MIGSHTQDLKEAIISALRADSAVAGVVETRVFGEMQKEGTAWPFVRYGLPSDSAYYASGWATRAHSVALHVFAKGRGSRQVNFLSGLVIDALHEKSLDLAGGGGAISLLFANCSAILDTEETGAYHAIITFDVLTAEVI